MLKKTGLWRGLAGLLVAVMMLAIFATVVLFQYAPVINKELGIRTSVPVNKGNSDEDTEYYKSDFGAINADNLVKLEEAAYAQTVAEAEEGAVLLKNDDVGGRPALPLAADERKVTLFGRATYKPLYRTSAACTEVTTKNPELVIDLNKALTAADFDVNRALYEAYAKGSGVERVGYAYNFEEPIDFYNARRDTWANYKQVALVMLSRSAGEGTDMSVDQSKGRNNTENPDFTADDVKNSLALQKREQDMLRLIKEQGFGKTVVLINTNYQMELDWLNDPAYGVDACLYIGTSGLTGFTGIVNVLTGDATPSGKLVDTFAANSLSSPAIVNACGNTPQWANVDTYQNSGIVKDFKSQTSYVSVQQENIYVGYKYYETRYADAVAGDAGANSEVGSSFAGGWDYAKEICYPFGYGLSYTEFRQTIEDVVENGDGTYTVKVRVENVGATAAKSVVQVYVNTPYGEYEKNRKIEKPAILFVGFEKTGVVEPGADNAVVIDVTVEEYLFASYDYTDTKGYVLTAGDYYFAVGGDAHEAVNNVLAAKGHTGLVDHEGNAVTPAENTTHQWQMDLDTTTYRYGEGGEESGVEVTNRFDKMDINYWEGNSVEYLTRSDWSGTFPTSPAEAYVKGTEMETLLQGDFYTKPVDGPSTAVYAQGKDNNWEGVDNKLPFVTMRNIKYDNEEVWEMFLDQFDLAELALMTGNYFGNNPIAGSPINLGEKAGGDGCQGVGGKPYDETLTGGKLLWPCLYTSLMTCTFNKELIENRGRLMANQSLFLGQAVIWTGGGNLHRTPYGGRQAEYYSEDANLCYIVGSIELPAMEKLGILGGIKHFAANDQESYREGLNTFYTEQAFREGALRGFEGAIRKGKVNAVMQAFNRQGVVYSSSCYELNVTVLREEWGFKGKAITDASSGVTTGYKSHYTTSMTNGTDVYCLDGQAVGGGIIAKAIQENDDGYLLGWFRKAAKHTAYALSRSAAINGFADDTVVEKIIPVWQILTVTVMGVTIALAVASLVLFALSIRTKAAQKKKV